MLAKNFPTQKFILSMISTYLKKRFFCPLCLVLFSLLVLVGAYHSALLDPFEMAQEPEWPRKLSELIEEILLSLKAQGF